jgi:heme-degrading monooxygenase HmoA
MFACRVSMHLKPNCTDEFIQKLEQVVVPILEKQKGYQDQVTFVAEDGTEAFGITLWDKAESAKAYSLGTHRTVAKILSRVVEGTPRVETYEISHAYAN